VSARRKLLVKFKAVAEAVAKAQDAPGSEATRTDVGALRYLRLGGGVLILPVIVIFSRHRDLTPTVAWSCRRSGRANNSLSRIVKKRRRRGRVQNQGDRMIRLGADKESLIRRVRAVATVGNGGARAAEQFPSDFQGCIAALLQVCKRAPSPGALSHLM
jgi:hypothetical protein